MQMDPQGRTWQVRQTTLEVDLGLLEKNYRILQKRAGPAEMLVLLKSDAYGHSHRGVAAALEKLPADARLHGFGVANVEEGIELRRAGVTRPIYVLSGIQQYNQELHRCLQTCDLVPVISSLHVLRQLSQTLRNDPSTRSVHLKFNTGMNRLGIDVYEVAECLKILKASPGIDVQGLMSHFAAGEKAKLPQTKSQVKQFEKILADFSAAGIQPRFRHMANSSGLATSAYTSGNLVRVGLHLYGADDAELIPVARWTAQVYQVRDLKKGDPVGYGPHFRAKKKMKMAILGVGYGDGYRRAFSNKAEVLVRGKRCRVIGAVSMDLTAIDVTKVPEISGSDRAVLLGDDGKERITPGELAKHAKSISWEIFTGISARVPRVFLNG
ncbi:MAG: alanine racemase [Bdellovibrionota bacterium]